MSNLLEQASLVMIPSAYKEDVVYSEIPLDGSGDLTFTRASTGTRVNFDGLVEVVPWNMLSNSEEFSSANGWSASIVGGSTASQTSDYGVAPNGTTTADRIQLALNGEAYADWVVVPTTGIIVGQVYTYSIYMKSLSGTPTIYFFNDNTANIPKTLTTDWVRYDYTWTATSTTIYPRFLLQSGSSTSADLLAWGYQLNIGSTAKPYFPTTDRLNVPRLTYQNGGGGCPSLLLEKQSTNISNYNESSSAFNAAIVTSASDLLGMKAYNVEADYSLGDAPNVPCSDFIANTTYTSSMYVDFNSLTGTQFVVTMLGFFPSVEFATMTVNKSTKAITSSTTGGGIWTINAAKIEHQKDEIYRVILTATPNTTGGGARTYADSGNFESANVAGIQVEASSYATSVILKSTSASATRVADACYKTGISSLIGQTSGSVFFDFTVDTISAQTSDPVLWYMKDGGAGERYVELYSNGNLIYVEIDGGGPIATITKSALTVGRHKCAIAYATNDFVFYVDGLQVGTDTSGTPNGFSTFGLQYYLSAYTGQQKVNEAILFPTRLTNAQLAYLTTL